MAEASPGSSLQQQARHDDERDLETREPQRKRWRTTKSSTLQVASSIDVDEGEPNTVGSDDPASENAQNTCIIYIRIVYL